MGQVLRVIASILNNVHDFIIYISNNLGFNLTDKELHFWIVGSIGIIIFFIADIIFKHLAKWSISFITFIFTLTVLMVFVFGLEIEQKITGRGNMEFSDIVSGIWGFVTLFSIYLITRITASLIKKKYSSKKV